MADAALPMAHSHISVVCSIACGEDFWLCVGSGGVVYYGSYGRDRVCQVLALGAPTTAFNNQNLDAKYQHRLYSVLTFQSATGILLHRPAYVCQLATAYQNWAVACAVHIRAGRYVAAMLCRARLTGLASAMDDWIVLGWMRFDPAISSMPTASPSLTAQHKLQCLWQACWRWKGDGLSAKHLEDWLVEAMQKSPEVVRLVLQLLVKPPAPPPPMAESPLVVDGLSIARLLQVGLAALGTSPADSSPHLWESVCSNLSKDLARPDWALLAHAASRAAMVHALEPAPKVRM